MAFNYALRIGAAIIFLTGCGGGFQPATGPQTDPGRSQMQPGATGEDLLYAAVGNSTVYAISLPEGQVAGKISGLNYPWGLCSDNKGDVFITEPYRDDVVEYAHGGTSPINTLHVEVSPTGCSSDPTTGNLAVVGDSNNVAIFKGARGTAQTFSDPDFENLQYCAYDDKGNLFLSGSAGVKAGLTEFNATAGNFTTISVNKPIGVGDLRWDGKYLVVAAERSGNYSLYQVKVSGSAGTVVGTTVLTGPQRVGPSTWIQGDRLVMPFFGNGLRKEDRIDIWRYPSGGEPIQTLPRSDFKAAGPIRGVTISVAG